jgi:hypothetical protein
MLSLRVPTFCKKKLSGGDMFSFKNGVFEMEFFFEKQCFSSTLKFHPKMQFFLTFQKIELQF